MQPVGILILLIDRSPRDSCNRRVDKSRGSSRNGGVFDAFRMKNRTDEDEMKYFNCCETFINRATFFPFTTLVNIDLRKFIDPTSRKNDL